MTKSMNPDGTSRAMSLRRGDVIAGAIVLDDLIGLDGFGDEITDRDRQAAWCRPWEVDSVARYYDDPSQVNVETVGHGVWALPADLIVTVYDQPERKAQP